MVVAEHLDWHTSLNEYIEAKQQLFRWQKAEDTAIFYAVKAVSTQIASVGKARKIPYFAEPGATVQNDRIIIGEKTICSVGDIKPLGKHNWQNVCAAVTTVWQVTQDVEAIRNAIKTVDGLPFRLEFVRQLNRVKYYNDSFGTTARNSSCGV